MSLFVELKRRNVFRVAAAYVVATWLLLQIVDVLVPILTLPEWVGRLVFLLLVIGFPIALIFAWAFEMTPEGIKKESQVDRSKSIVDRTGRKLDRAIIVVLAVALAWFAWDKFFVGDSAPVSSSTTQTATSDDLPDKVLLNTSVKSVAVLPFIAMSSGPDDEYFADGLTEEILNSLAQLPELLVTARTSAFSFKGQEIPVQEIAAALGVRHIVEGSVRRSGERLRVTAQLIRAADGFHLWSENYDSTSADTIEVQENIAEKIALALDIVLDENKRTAMRHAGLRDVQAFTNYQKGMEWFNRAHGDVPTVEGLREANVYFDKVIERVPEFWQVYSQHADLFIHILADDVARELTFEVTEQDLEDAYSAAIADYESAIRYARTPTMRLMAELDLATASGNWRGLTGRLERAMAVPDCTANSNWMSEIADLFGYAADYHQRMIKVLPCDPRRSIFWFNTARSALYAGDGVAALRFAREGAEIAPGGWVNDMLIRSLLVNDQIDEAAREIDSRIQDAETALVYKAMIAAYQGDRPLLEQLIAEYEAREDADDFWGFLLHAWGGHRDVVNAMAAEMDQHRYGFKGLLAVAHWCTCGAAWDLEATPNLAAKLKESNLPWPPPSPMTFPLKDW